MSEEDENKTKEGWGEGESPPIARMVSEDAEEEERDEETSTESLDTSDGSDEDDDNPFPEDFPTSLFFGGNRQGRGDYTPVQVDHLFLSQMPSVLLLFSGRFFASGCRYIPSNPGYEMRYPGGLGNPGNLQGNVMISFMVDDECRGWVETYSEWTKKIKWMRVGRALGQDPAQFVFEVIRRGLIFQNRYWWMVVDWLHVLKPDMVWSGDDDIHIHQI